MKRVVIVLALLSAIACGCKPPAKPYQAWYWCNTCNGWVMLPVDGGSKPPSHATCTYCGNAGASFHSRVTYSVWGEKYPKGEKK
jgi:hypothetical protein